MDKIDILGVKVNTITIADAVSQITAYAGSQKPAQYVVKPYATFIIQAQKNPVIKNTLNQAWLCLPDGASLRWAAYYLYGGHRTLWRWIRSIFDIIFNPQMLNYPLPERFGGTNFTLTLIKNCQQKNLSIYLIGSPRDSHINRTASFLRAEFPGLRIGGTFPGRLTASSKLQLAKELQATRPDVILVGTGFPRQEFLMNELASKLKHGILVGEGGTFDYTGFGGKLPKAPGWMQSVGLEWLWRLWLQPWRIRRQTAIPQMLWQVYTHRHSHQQAVTRDPKR